MRKRERERERERERPICLAACKYCLYKDTKVQIEKHVMFGNEVQPILHTSLLALIFVFFIFKANVKVT
jgi:hypothetical protein